MGMDIFLLRRKSLLELLDCNMCLLAPSWEAKWQRLLGMGGAEAAAQLCAHVAPGSAGLQLPPGAP